MGTMTNTTWWGMQECYTGSSDGARIDLNPTTVYIPETSNLVFKQAVVKVSAASLPGGAMSANALWMVGIKLGAVAASDFVVNETQNWSNQGCWSWSRDVTGYFQGNWTGTSMACVVSLSGSGANFDTSNVTAELFLTYQADTQDTRIKTVMIPLESNKTNIQSGTFQELKSVPALDTFCAEGSKTFRNIYFRLLGDDGCGRALNPIPQLHVKLDAETGILDSGRGNNVSNVSSLYHFNYVRNDMATNTTHTLNVSRGVAGSPGLQRFPSMTGLLVATYEYSEAATSTVTNSTQYAMDFETRVVPTGSYGPAKGYLEFMVPQSASLLQSAIMVHHSYDPMSSITTAAPTSSVGVGNQSPQAYDGLQSGLAAAGKNDSPVLIMHRFDSNATAGLGHALIRGRNTLTASLSQVGIDVPMHTNGAIVYLNYSSAVHPSGSHLHPRTLYWSPFVTQPSARRVSATMAMTGTIPEPYWLDNVGVLTDIWGVQVTAGLTGVPMYAGINLQLSGAQGAPGWRQVGMGMTPLSPGGDSARTINVFDATRHFRRHVRGLREGRMSISSSATWDLINGADALTNNRGPFCALYTFATMHGITYDVSGTLTSNSSTTNVPIDLVLSSSGWPPGEHVLRMTADSAGAFSGSWFDDSIRLIALVEQTGQRGASYAGLAGHDRFDIDTRPAGGTTLTHRYYMRARDSGTGGWVYFHTTDPAAVPASGDTSPNYTGTLTVYEILTDWWD